MLPQVGVPSCTPAVADTAEGWLRPLNFKETLPVFQESARGSQICWAQGRMLRGSPGLIDGPSKPTLPTLTGPGPVLTSNSLDGVSMGSGIWCLVPGVLSPTPFKSPPHFAGALCKLLYVPPLLPLGSRHTSPGWGRRPSQPLSVTIPREQGALVLTF